MSVDNPEKNEWKEEDELGKLKRNMAENIIKEYNKNQWGLLSDIFKDNIVDYLVDDSWSFLFEVALKLWFLKDSAEELENLRDAIKNTNEKEALSSLEEKTLDNIKNKWVFYTKETTSNENAGNANQNAEKQIDSNEKNNSEYKSDYDAIQEVDYNTPHLDSAPLWQAKEVPLSKRKEWLFPNWVPETQAEMLKYITKIKVPIHTPNGKKDLTLNIHKKLANEYQAIFQEMCDKKIPVNPSSTWWFNRRKMRKWSKMSHHSYWSAVDLNWDVNGGVYGKTDKESLYFNNEETVNIWKKHGFYRGWDWKKSNNDPMHFTYMNG